MKKALAGLVAGIVLGTAGVAGASTMWGHTENGVYCKSMSGGIGCLKTDGTGFGVGIHRDFVFVMKEGGGRVFTRYQP